MIGTACCAMVSHLYGACLVLLSKVRVRWFDVLADVLAVSCLALQGARLEPSSSLGSSLVAAPRVDGAA